MFFQPETLAVYELLLEHKEQELLEAWRVILTVDELFLLANEFGYAYSEIAGVSKVYGSSRRKSSCSGRNCGRVWTGERWQEHL